MCGILLTFANCPLDLELLNANRGPDFNAKKQAKTFCLQSFVLHLRGQATEQPIETDKFVLAYNGEIYYYGQDLVEGNDTLFLSSIFKNCITEQDVLQVISQLRGEWALVLYFKDLGKIYLGRDFLGRKSLLWHQPQSDVGQQYFGISSVSDGSKGWEEIPCTGVFSISIDDSTFKITNYTWNDIGCPKIFVNMSCTSSLPTIFDDTKLPVEKSTYPIKKFHDLLNTSVKARVTTIPLESPSRLAILFSGGIDCMVLAGLCDEHLGDGAVDLLNVSFENPRVNKAKNNFKVGKKGNLVDECMDNANSPDGKNDVKEAGKYDTPDRLTGIKGVAELRKLYPKRKWNFVKVNVSYEDAMAMKERIRMLMYPLTTVMDLSIAMAFWFASRGMGEIDDDLGGTKSYHSKAKVLLSGLGADEQLGGYSRHRKAFERGSWTELVKEIELDVDRISSRNLGRDDRIISDHGKEVRFPFLDENVVEFLSSLEIQQKTDPRYIRAVGDKILLRLVAESMGLQRASNEAKRAVQFGARTAKMEFSKEKGHQEL